jgi:FKBP12-rapamycin complex-associated protein
MGAEQFQRFFDMVNQRTMGLIQGTDTYDRMGGVYILDALVDFDGIEPALKYSRFQQYIGTILRGKDLNPMQPAAVVLGKLCKPGGSLISELVDAEVQTALEWMQSDRVEERRYSAVLVLRELARNAPTLMYPYVGFVFDHIWIGLRDTRHLIRATSSETVSACFKIIRERDQEMKQEWMDKMFTEAVRGLKNNTVEYIHASLLVLKELLEQGGMYMQSHYQDACEIVFRHKDARDPAIRKTVVLLIPDLANYAPTEFGGTYLHKFMVYLSGMLKKEKERNDAFLAIGNIANSVKSSIAPYLDGVLIYVREGLSVQSRKRGSVDPVFDCISRLAVAVGQTLSKYMEALLDPIFACELTPKLTQALVDMAFYIPPVKGTIQERLLNMLSKVLCGEPFRPLGAPHPNPISSIPPIPKDPKDPSVHERGKAEVKLALNTLGSFDFSGNCLTGPFVLRPLNKDWLRQRRVGEDAAILQRQRLASAPDPTHGENVLTDSGGHVLNEFVRDVAIKYVEDDDPEIREAAALTCCQLYVRDPIVNQTSYHALQVVADVVETLLTVGVSDPEPKIRRTVLAALDERFDQHLAKAENIRTLFFALHDEQFAVREVAVSIIGRLARHNPAYVIPQLRKTVIQMLTELEYTDVARSKEESSKLLSLLTQHAQDLVKPYVSSITEVLLPKASDPTPSVAATILQAIGELCTVGGAEMLAYKDTLMPIIIDALQDQSAPIKREAALHTLGQLASNAGYVIRPYLEYPQLLEILQSIIRGEPQHGPLRQETIKLMGILGALDPYKYQVQRISSFIPPHHAHFSAMSFASPTLVDSDDEGGDESEDADFVPPSPYLEKPHQQYSKVFYIRAKTPKQQVEERAPQTQRRPEATQLTDVSLMMGGLTPSQEDYYPTVVINALLHILKDQSLVQWHGNVVDAIMSIFITLGLKCVQFLDRVVPAFIAVIRASSPARLDFYFNHLSRLVSIVRQHIRVYLPDIIVVLQEFWNTTSSLQTTIMALIESIARSLEGEFKIYLAGLLPLMLGVLEKDASTKRQPTEKIFHAFLVFGSSAEEYMHLIIPILVRLFDNPAQPMFLRKSAIETIGKLSSMVNLNDYASKIIHPLTRVLASQEPSLRVAALDTLCALMLQLGRDYLHFEHTVDKATTMYGIQHSNYDKAVEKLKKGEALPQNLAPRFEDTPVEPYSSENNPPKKLDLNPMHLKQAWETKGKSTKDDWHEWFRKFSTTLLSESPNHSLRACASLASNYQPLARELFNSAFVSCWGELYDQHQVWRS